MFIVYLVYLSKIFRNFFHIYPQTKFKKSKPCIYCPFASIVSFYSREEILQVRWQKVRAIRWHQQRVCFSPSILGIDTLILEKGARRRNCFSGRFLRAQSRRADKEV